MIDCSSCRLCETRTQVVPGFGDLDKPVMIIGEAPGASEDVGGEPFIGRSGKLLFKLLGEQGISREDCYITNTVKCRPPKNRRPKPDEIAACSTYLEQELNLSKSRVIITLGGTSTMAVLKRTGALQSLRGVSMGYGKRIISTYHPAAALYNGKLVHELRSDLCLIDNNG